MALLPAKYSFYLVLLIGLIAIVGLSKAEHGDNSTEVHSNETVAEGGSHGNETEGGSHGNETYVEGGEGHGNETEGGGEGGGHEGEEGGGEHGEEEEHGLNHQIVILISAISMVIFILLFFYVFYKLYTRYIEYKHEQEAQWHDDKDPLEGAILATAITGAAAPAILGFHELQENEGNDDKRASTSGSENAAFKKENGSYKKEKV